MADDQTAYVIDGPDGKTYRFVGKQPTPEEISAISQALTPKPPKPSLLNQVGHGVTMAAPVIGGTLGAMAGAPVGGVGGIAGAGAGTMGGESVRELLNHWLFGDPTTLSGPLMSGLTTAASTGAMMALPGAIDAVKGIPGDLERTGNWSSMLPGIIRRGTSALRAGPGPILTQPEWQRTIDAPVTDTERELAGTIGKKPLPTSPISINRTPDVWERVANEGGAPETGVPPEVRDDYRRWAQQYGKEKADRMLQLWRERGGQTASKPSTPSGGGTGSPPPSSAPTGPPKPPAGPPPTSPNGGGVIGHGSVRSGGMPVDLAGAKAALREAGFSEDTISKMSNAEILRQGSEEADVNYELRTGRRYSAPIDSRVSALPPEPTAPPKTSGPQGVGSNRQTESDLNQRLAQLREDFGAKRIGQKMRPDAPEVGTGAVLKAAPGKSAMPQIARDALNRDINSRNPVDSARVAQGLKQLLDEEKRNQGGRSLMEILQNLNERFGPGAQ